jgi:phosphohistidine swiveling domain-containing protein
MSLKKTKAECQSYLYKIQNKFDFKIPKTLFFTKEYYLKNKNLIFKKIKKKFKEKIAIRSSSREEDNKLFSNAGKYKSFLNVFLDKKKIIELIDEIIIDFKNNNDQILIQEFISSTDLNGVVFTCDASDLSPYYVINYDTSSKTNLVTSGIQNPTIKKFVLYKSSEHKFPKKLKNLVHVIKTLEEIFKSEKLDIEFSIKKNLIYIFQVRHLPIKGKLKNHKMMSDILVNIHKKIKKIQLKNPYLSGNTTYLSNMADWNPAEMIGTKPKPLAISLYSELITDSNWAKQRFIYGYQDVRPNQLMINLAGSPYIDLRVDFNSFLPKDLDIKLKDKIINYYLSKVKKAPHLHDKIEFEILETCYDLQTTNNLKFFLNPYEIKRFSKSLKIITNALFRKKNNQILMDIKKIKQLDFELIKIKNNKLSHIQKIFFYVDVCKRLGTLPFSGIARSAFITTKILKSLKEKKLINVDQYKSIFENINTISNQIISDYKKYNLNKITKNYFKKKYGHLRPYTYSISSKNYDEGFDIYFPKKETINRRYQIKKTFAVLKNNKLNFKINKILKSAGLKFNFQDLINLTRKCIYYREQAKFIFTKSINLIFKNMLDLGKEINISRPDLEFISIKNLLAFNSNLDAAKISLLLKKQIKYNKKIYNLTKNIKLKDIIFSADEVYSFEEQKMIGNFVTNKNIVAELIELTNWNMKNIKDKIVMIENADPGFDFIFTYGIKGLITKYGGANSHMAIRCMELSIPGVIGVGESIFDKLKKQNILSVDCSQKQINIVN